MVPSLRQAALDLRFTVSPGVLRAGRRLEAVRRAVSLIDQDRHMDAVTVLEPYSSHPDTWNILGAAYGHAGDMASAEQFFNKAASAGCRQGAHNLAELRRSRE